MLQAEVVRRRKVAFKLKVDRNFTLICSKRKSKRRSK